VGKKYILTESQANLKICRMALEILERNTHAAAIILAGVAPNGVIIAQKIRQYLTGRTQVPVYLQTITLNKKHPDHIDIQPEMVPDTNTVVVLVDDVGNSGRTLTYALKPYLQYHPAGIQTLVLVDRTHKQFPIHPDYVGLSLASTIEEYIDLDVEGDAIKGAWMR
jgi:pyrimidine operon attenuation protein/uracil phosphoribosyltransferase